MNFQKIIKPHNNNNNCNDPIDIDLVFNLTEVTYI